MQQAITTTDNATQGASLTKEQLIEQINLKLPQLREVSNYHATASSSGGCLGVVLLLVGIGGVIAVFDGLAGHILLLAIGGVAAVLAAIGGYILLDRAKNRPEVAIADGIVQFLLGMAAYIYVFSEVSKGNFHDTTALGIGVLVGTTLTGFGVSHLKSYKTRKEILENRPPADIDAIWQEVRRFMRTVDPAENPDIVAIDLKVTEGSSNTRLHKLWLLDNVCVLRGNSTSFLEPSKLNLAVKKEKPHKKVEISATFNASTSTGFISSEDMAKYQHWKKATSISLEPLPKNSIY